MLGKLVVGVLGFLVFGVGVLVLTSAAVGVIWVPLGVYGPEVLMLLIAGVCAMLGGVTLVWWGWR